VLCWCAQDMEESRAKIMQQAEHLEKLVVELRAARIEAESASRLKSQFLVRPGGPDPAER